MYKFLLAFVLVLTSLGSWAQTPHQATMYDGVYQTLLKRSYFPIDEERCSGPLHSLIENASRGENTDWDILRIKAMSCIDPHSRITSLSVEFDEFGILHLKPVESEALVASSRLDGIRYITMRNFAPGVTHKLAEALYQAQNETIIIVLRGNPGGRVSELISAANFFAPRKDAPMFVTHYKSSRRVVVADVEGYFANNSICILVNEKTASAAEIFAAILKNWGGARVLIVGEKTFGKSTVQVHIPNIESLVNLVVTVAVITVGSVEQNTLLHGIAIKPDLQDKIPHDVPGFTKALQIVREYYGARVLNNLN